MDQKVKYWLDLADYDLETAKALLQSKRFLYVGFMCHQAIEKVLKAYYVQKIGAFAPKTHNLRALAQKSGILQLIDNYYMQIIISLEPLNIEARYPTDKEKLFRSLTQERCEDILNSTSEIYSWIKKKLEQ